MPNKAQDDDLVMSLVELALARPPEEREAYLRSACTGDSQFNEAWNYVQWEQRMQGFLLDPLYPPEINEHPFEPGELLMERFRIVREVARGGMGIVYEAVDQKLERRIALKCAKTGFHKRLPPEVRNASEISHPNVCKIFEIHTASAERGEIDFLTMEFLEGETLAERLRRAPVPEEEARTIARQLCAGLAEAHRKQVIHGDLKSNNVILTTGADGASRAVITDFGLARRPEASQRAASSGALGGTPDYMAPELLKGGKATVASDIYALGVILYELVSGRRPNQPARRSVATTVSLPERSWEQRLTQAPPPVDPRWDRLLARCLDPDPARRFHSVEEVGKALEPRSRRWLLWAAVAVVLAAVSGVITYQRATAPSETVRLAILPFAADQDTSAIAESLLRSTAVQLGRLKGSTRTGLTFVPLNNSLRNKVDTPEKARTLLRATHVLRGALVSDGGRVVIHAYLTDARSGVNAKDWQVDYAPGDVRYAPVALAGMVTETLHFPPLALAVTVNAAAKQDYQAGLNYLERWDGVDAGLAVLERSVAADPDSPLTHAALAYAEWLKYALTTDQAWLDRARDSVRMAQERNPDLAQVHAVAGLLKGNSGFYEQAVVEYQRAIELDPMYGDAYRRLGAAYQANNQFDEALAAFRKAVEVQPNDFKPYQSLGAFYYRRGDIKEAVKALQNMVRLAPDLSDSHFALASAYRDLGRFGEAEKELRVSITLKDTARAEHNLGYVLMQEGREEEAIPIYRRALALGPETALLWLNMGISSSRAGHPSEAQEAFRRGLELAEKEMARNPRYGGARANMSYLYARLGDSRRALLEAAEAVQLSPNDKDTRTMAVETYEVLGRRDLALSVLGSSDGTMLPSMLAELNRYPDVADLRKDPRFLQMLASYHVQ